MNLAQLRVMSSVLRPCAMRSRSICSRPAPTCAPSSSCSGIGALADHGAVPADRDHHGLLDRESAGSAPTARPRTHPGRRLSAHGRATRRAHRGGGVPPLRRYLPGRASEAALSTAHSRVMTAIEQCRTAALGGHVEQCDHCGHRRVWVQLLSQPPLSDLSVAGPRRVARTAPGGPAAHRVLPRRLHRAPGDRRDRRPEQGRRLRSTLPNRRRDAPAP